MLLVCLNTSRWQHQNIIHDCFLQLQIDGSTTVLIEDSNYYIHLIWNYLISLFLKFKGEQIQFITIHNNFFYFISLRQFGKIKLWNLTFIDCKKLFYFFIIHTSKTIFSQVYNIEKPVFNLIVFLKVNWILLIGKVFKTFAILVSSSVSCLI